MLDATQIAEAAISIAIGALVVAVIAVRAAIDEHRRGSAALVALREATRPALAPTCTHAPRWKATLEVQGEVREIATSDGCKVLPFRRRTGGGAA